MQKPRKPSPIDPAPSKVVYKSYPLGINKDGKGVLITPEKFPEAYTNGYCNIYDIKDDIKFNYISDNGSFEFSILNDVKNQYSDIFSVNLSEFRENNNSYLEIILKKPNPNYEKELAAFENRFIQYEEDLKEYEKLKKQQISINIEKKKQKLLKELKKLEGK